MATHHLRRKRARSISTGTPDSTSIAASSSSQATTPPESPTKSKKLKLHSSFAVESPFPQFAHPTASEAFQVYQLLSKAHHSHDPVRKPPAASTNSAQTCGSVPNVIEALIDTILSQNTSGKNCSRAKTGLDAAFGRNNFAAISQAPRDEVVNAIRSGGLANKKAATIQNILRAVKARHGQYSLQHLGAAEEGKRMSDDEIMKELLCYDGVGPKTASCVLLFCLGRDSFAVDTHIFRLSKVLKWVPAQADRILAQAHLDLRIPNELKYGLHVLMIQHGRVCKGCKTSDSGESCILKAYVKEQNSRSELRIRTLDLIEVEFHLPYQEHISSPE